MADYDVVIIGAGPAGIFTALELADTGQKILLLEKGHDITTRAAQNADRATPLEERRRNIVCGWGGAGAFSDGKLTLTTEYGGNLDDFMSKAALQKEIDHVDAVYSQYGGTVEQAPLSPLLRAAIDAFDEAGPDAAFEQGLAVIVDGLAKRRLVVRNVEGPRKGDD